MRHDYNNERDSRASDIHGRAATRFALDSTPAVPPDQGDVALFDDLGQRDETAPSDEVEIPHSPPLWATGFPTPDALDLHRIEMARLRMREREMVLNAPSSRAPLSVWQKLYDDMEREEARAQQGYEPDFSDPADPASNPEIGEWERDWPSNAAGDTARSMEATKESFICRSVMVARHIKLRFWRG